VNEGHLFLRDKVIPVLAFLQATESHLCAGDVFLGVFEVLILAKVSYGQGIWSDSSTDQCIFRPCNSLLLIGIGVREAFYLTSFAAKKTV
jgi:hypothetical protein